MSGGSAGPFDLRGRAFLVTGAASGIGRATAVMLAARGARLALTDVAGEGLERLLPELEGQGHVARPYDLRNAGGIGAWLAETAAAFGKIHGFVHAAGISCVSPVKALSLDALREVLAVNAESAFALAKGFITPKVYAGENGSLVFISSVMSLVGSPASAGYAMSKGAVNSLTRALALELAGKAIRVNAIAPGFVKTPMLDRTAAGWDEAQRRRVEALHPLGFGEPEDVAGAAAFLLSDGARWITGTVIAVDGGYSAQ